jgi:DNA gyrase/topoisomerase IV subunit B
MDVMYPFISYDNYTMSIATDLSSKYQKMTDLEHILKKPDTYIGSIQLTECTEYTAMTQGEGDATNIGLATFTHIPALYKLVDEGLVNMRDHVIRQAQAIKDGKPDALPVTSIEVEVDAATGIITMTNDGNGIDIAQHPEHKMWIPEMIFGHLRTSTNYAEDKKEKIVGGKNGFGFKLVLVWSTWAPLKPWIMCAGSSTSKNSRRILPRFARQKSPNAQVRNHIRASRSVPIMRASALLDLVPT